METDNRSSYFNGAEIREKIKELIGRSESSIQVAMAWFTDPEIFEAIEQALDRGVRVSLVIGENEDNDRLPFNQLESKGATVVRIAGRGRGVMHNKFAIIDDKYVLNGSYNWTLNAAKNNSENMHIIRDNQTIMEYKENFNDIISNNVGLPEENINDIIHNIQHNKDDQGLSLAERFHAALKDMVFAHFNRHENNEFSDLGYERSEYYNGDSSCVVGELDAIKGRLVQDVDDNHRTLLLTELDNMERLYQNDIDEEIENEKERIESINKNRLDRFEERISLNKERSEEIDKSLIELNGEIGLAKEKISRERQKIDELDEEFKLNDVNWVKFAVTFALSILLGAYLFIFYSSAFYILLYTDDDIAKANAARGEANPPGIYLHNAWEKAIEMGNGAPLMLGMGVLIPLLLATCSLFVKPKWLGETITYLVGIFGFDFFVAWKISEANFDAKMSSGDASSLDEKWEFSMLFTDGDFYLVLIMGALGLFFFKHLVTTVHATLSSRDKKYQSKMKKVRRKKIDRELEELLEKESELSAKVQMLNDEKTVCKNIGLDSLENIKSNREQLNHKLADLSTGKRGLRESISNIADNYRVQINAGNISHQWRMVAAFYADFINGWNQYLFNQYSNRVAGERQNEAQKLFILWRDENYRDDN